MTAFASALLRGAAPELPAARTLGLCAAASAAFGAAIGAYVGRWQILYAALKMPVYFLATLALSFAAMHLFAARERRTFQVALETVALTTLVLAGLAPVALLASLSLPYTAVVLALTTAVACGGVVGVVRLHARLRSLRLTAAWVAIYQFVGAQTAWLLKPWVGSTGTDDRVLPLRENLEGNFYESVFRIVVSMLS